MSSSFNHNHNSHRPSHRIPSNSSSSSGVSNWHNNRWTSNNNNGGDDPVDMEQLFTSEMRDRQARGKDPYAMDEGASSNTTTSMRMSGGAGGAPSSRHPKEPFQKTERRDWAETVLDNPELLLMYAQSNGDTLPATRLRFKRIMCGLEDSSDEDDSDEVDFAGQQQYGQQYNHQQQQQPRFSSSASASSSQKSGSGGNGRGSSGGGSRGNGR